MVRSLQAVFTPVCATSTGPGGGQRRALVTCARAWWVCCDVLVFFFCDSSSVLAVFSGLHRRAVLAVRGSLAARHVQTRPLLRPTAAVQCAKVNPMSCYGVRRVITPQVPCVCGSGCGVNGHDYPNGARIPAGDPCQDCTCAVRHQNKLGNV